MSNCRAMIAMPLFRFTRPGFLAALLLTAPAACGPSTPAEAPDELPGVPPGEAEWFWRNVLASPFPGELGPDDAALRGTEIEVVDALVDLVNERAQTALPTLLKALNDPREGVSLVAAEQLGRLGDRRAIPRLIKGLGPYPVDYDPSLHRRAAQAAALAALEHPAGVNFLLSALSNAVRSPRNPDREAGMLTPAFASFVEGIEPRGTISYWEGDDYVSLSRLDGSILVETAEAFGYIGSSQGAIAGGAMGMGVLLPALGKARESAQQVKGASRPAKPSGSPGVIGRPVRRLPEFGLWR